MKPTWFLPLAAFHAALAADPSIADLAIGAPAPAFSLPGIDGKTHTLDEYKDAQVLIIAFISNHCPDSQAAEGRIKRLVDDLKDRPARLVAINPNNPEGLRPVIVNWEELCWSFIARLHRETELAPEGRGHAALLAELSRYPDVPSRGSLRDLSPQPFLTVHLRRPPYDLRLFTVLTAFGTPLDVTAQELTIETFFPADEPSDAQLRRMAEGGP